MKAVFLRILPYLLIAGAVALAITVLSPHMPAVHAQSPPNQIFWSNSLLNYDQNGAIELGSPGTGQNPTNGATPYIDFHYGNGQSQDYNFRVVNDGDGVLSFVQNSTPVIRLRPTGIEIDRGVSQSGTGLKHVRAGGCSGSTVCNVTVIWPGAAFSDTNYTAICTPDVSAFPISLVAKTKSSVTVSVTGAGTVSMGGVECIAIHDQSRVAGHYVRARRYPRRRFVLVRVEKYSASLPCNEALPAFPHQLALRHDPYERQ